MEPSALGQVSVVLGDAGYAEKRGALRIGALKLEFRRVFEGPNGRSGLILADEITGDPGVDAHVLRRIRACLSALDQMGSRRQLAIVVIAQPAARECHAWLSASMRTIWLSPQASLQETQDALAALLPLRIPQAQVEGADGIRELRKLVTHDSRLADSDAVRTLIAAAGGGAVKVENAFLTLVQSSIAREAE